MCMCLSTMRERERGERGSTVETTAVERYQNSYSIDKSEREILITSDLRADAA